MRALTAILLAVLHAGCRTPEGRFPYAHPDVEHALARRILPQRIAQRITLTAATPAGPERREWLARQLAVEELGVGTSDAPARVLARLPALDLGQRGAVVVAARGERASAQVCVLECASALASALRAHDLPRAPFELRFALLEGDPAAGDFGPTVAGPPRAILFFEPQPDGGEEAVVVAAAPADLDLLAHLGAAAGEDNERGRIDARSSPAEGTLAVRYAPGEEAAAVRFALAFCLELAGATD